MSTDEHRANHVFLLRAVVNEHVINVKRITPNTLECRQIQNIEQYSDLTFTAYQIAT